ncbi:uncharacterized protein LACBIDRAFT_329072 [Laccaria bicolor S238N-H82]|uniref:Predicted protein n=1 Tax=Laccaria bicolor (strain S238N-H82 / ATCC MYA-4686) TaxID=486041 RepID=B0DGY9_LACBS|nr:uncharacterized protein LACBIDRAFT_329072 [Laccaria bicolor S238N-H82]EDR06234.1 predicted protein [Laccaria bicolor S238N-H82]|eukprot:XP_001883095.1 predicted protein [Laccaria bicolor S238N-H82]
MLEPALDLNRYVYYRLYTTDGPIEAVTSVYKNNRYLGRISAKSITPPHTVASFTRCVLKVEGFTGVAKSELFPSLSSQFPMDGSSLLSVFGDSGPGLSEYEPMALVIDPSDAKASRVCSFLVAESEKTEFNEPLDEPYLYYRVYNEDGEVESLEKFNTADNSLGRISIASITPPHTIVTLKNRLAGAELIDKAQIAAMKLFKDITGQDLIKDDDDDPIFKLTGRSESRPMALIRPPRPANPDTEEPVKQAQALYAYKASPDDPNELSFKKGDIFDIIDSSGKWWEVEAADGSTGIVPSNFVQRYHRVRKSKSPTRRSPERPIDIQHGDGKVSPIKGGEPDFLEDDWWEVRMVNNLMDASATFLQKAGCVGLRAEALYDYRTTRNQPEELSFKKGDTFDVLDNSGRWWENTLHISRLRLKDFEEMLRLLNGSCDKNLADFAFRLLPPDNQRGL